MRHTFLYWAAAMLAYMPGVSAERPSGAVPSGFEAMARVERLPLLYPAGVRKNRALTYDASGGNGFGHFRSMFCKYVDERGEVVFFDAFGPGCLYREQMNIWTDYGVGARNKDIRIRFYFDDDTEPRIDVPVYAFFNGEHTPFTQPFMFRDGHMFGIGYYPFPFAGRLRITLCDPELARLVAQGADPTCNWFQFDYLTYPAGTAVETWTPAADSFEPVVRRQWERAGCDPKPEKGNRVVSQCVSLGPGESAVLFDHRGRGSVAAVRLRLEPFDARTFCRTRIRIRWDDQPQPAVDMPVSYFFGAGGADDGMWDRSLRNLLFGFDAAAGTAYCYWPMPFWKRAVVELVNDSDEPVAHVGSEVVWKPASVFAYPRSGTGYFRAKLTRDVSAGGATRKGFSKPYASAFRESGRGHVVALNMWSGNFYEDGDEFTYIDACRTPCIHGDGTEDDFNQGWAGGRHQKPLWGALNNGVKGSYRIHLNEPYIFYSDIDIRFEYTNSVYPGQGPRQRTGTDPALIETEFVAWYYHAPGGPALHLTDSLDVGNEADERAHDFNATGERASARLTQGYDSYESCDDYDMLTDDGRAFDGCEFRAALDPSNEGVRLRRRMNRAGNGLQRAAVYVDGQRLPQPWDITTYSEQPQRGERSFDGWFDAEYEIPAAYTRGKKSVRIRLGHLGPQPGGLNAYHYWVYCYEP